MSCDFERQLQDILQLVERLLQDILQVMQDILQVRE
jgi:hypothetical protein